MELEFDKEIDALLRKARPGETAANGAGAAVASAHLDADTISAFAENALPEKAKLLYMGHFADCDRCRRQLSQTVRLNDEAVATAASNSLPALPEVVSVPWYRNLFKTQNLALAMGALVIAFGGLLGYIAIQKQDLASNSSVAEVRDKEYQTGGPFANVELPAPAANTSSNSTSAANAPAPSTAAAANAVVANTASTPTGTVSGGVVGKVDSEDKTEEKEKPISSDDKPAAGEPADVKSNTGAAPPPAPVVGGSRGDAGRDRRSEPEKMKDEDAVLSERSKTANDNFSREAVPQAMKKAGGPLRSAGPVQNQTQANNQVFDMPVTRVVGGKVFDNKNGAWYDSAYHGQATVNVRRGTDEYKKLDIGVRNIASAIGGTVVIVWKDKAYRIY